MKTNIEFISAGAGSGKTYSLTKRLNKELVTGGVHPAGIIATTFTTLAAGELKERVRQSLMEDGEIELANRMGQATISTVNGVCGQLLQRFSFEAGLSPDQQVLLEGEATRLFGEALDQAIGNDPGRVQALNRRAERLGYVDNGVPQWRAHVSEIAKAARSNNMSVGDLATFARSSSDGLLRHFRKPIARDLDSELIQAIDQLLAQVDTDVDTTKTTREALAYARSAKYQLVGGRLPWSDWVKLSKLGGGKKSAEYFAAVNLIAEDFESHSKLHEDITEYTHAVFTLAGECIEHFQALKVRQGLLDFTDQELLLYRLLEQPEVKATLESELQLLMVDEFQDTSPIQLALFVRLAQLANKVIWVGDIKQAIYGFRGSDPALMKAVLDAVIAEGGTTSVLEKSWRSRPPLVEYCSQLFTAAFAGLIPAEQVRLEPAREEISSAPAVIRWKVGGPIANQLGQVATGIKELVDSGYQIVDKKTEVLRPLCLGDIAVLCRSNNRLAALAEVCVAVGVPVSYKRAGLLGTPECRLAMACLRQAADRRDTLATAEILSLAKAQSAEAWLPGRLQYLAEGNVSVNWGEDEVSPVQEVVDLAAIRSRLPYLSPSEALGEALVAGKVREAVNRWGPTSQRSWVRLANLDTLQRLAGEYEDHCDVNNLAATISGFILWLDELAENDEDWQAVSTDRDVLNLHTNHGAKGLEWPVVVAFDQEFTAKSRLWGLSTLGREGGFDVDNALQRRSMRFWPYPFGRQSSGIAVKERVEASTEGTAAMQSAVEEEQRLQYVSYTRARDLLVLPLKSETPEIMQTLRCNWIYPDGNELILPDGKVIPTALVEPEVSLGQSAEKAYETVALATERHEGTVMHRRFSPSSSEVNVSATIGEVIELGGRVGLGIVADMAELGTALHAILAKYLVYEGRIGPDTAEAIFDRFGVTGAIAPADALVIGKRLADYCAEKYPGSPVYVEHPVSWINHVGQEMNGVIDLLIDTPEGWVIIDHKSSPLPRSEWSRVAQEYAGQLDTYASAIEGVTGKPASSAWIHFAITGGLVEVKGVDAAVRGE